MKLDVTSVLERRGTMIYLSDPCNRPGKAKYLATALTPQIAERIVQTHNKLASYYEQSMAQKVKF
jgi:hypothetical protein